MKKIRVLGIFFVILAIAVTVVGVAADRAKEGNGAFAAKLNDARALVEAVSSNEKAVKNAAATEKKVAAAQGKLADALETTAQAIADAEALDAALLDGATGDADVDALRAALEQLAEGVDGLEGVRSVVSEAVSAALAQLDAGVDAVSVLTEEKTLALYQACVEDAYQGVADAQSAVDGVREGALKVYGLIGDEETAIDPVEQVEEPVCASIEECHLALEELAGQAEAMQVYADPMAEWAQGASAAAAEAAKLQVSVSARVTIALAENFIGVLFTAALLLAIALVMIFLAEPFRRQWRKNPVFSVGMALIVMLVLQTYALGFNQGSIGAWAKFWFDNTFNVLRANTSVGMIALGMTLIIITGGIDLAVGSTLAGVGTVLMVMIDTGENGVLIRLGITGIPAFAIGIAVALLAGVGIGAIIGGLVTKGRIPPFIVTLGVMNVVRSVAQYFTKSYTPTVPAEFQAIANTVILGQRPMTIIYWVVLAVIFYLIMKNTAFGRYVYAVGSNERTTRLSGINTDKVKMKVYMLSGLVVAIAAVAQLSRLGGMDVASAGSGYELDAIAAVVVGGTAMSGGRGSIVGTVLGVLIIGIMNNLLILLGVDSFLTDAFKGAIVVAAVLMQRKESEN
ncbi:MAG: ABC transporter permease [Candidatus Faecivicinus sp.]